MVWKAVPEEDSLLGISCWTSQAMLLLILLKGSEFLLDDGQACFEC